MKSHKPANRTATALDFQIKNLGGGRASIFIYDDIGPSWANMIGADTIRDELAELGQVHEIDLHINSRGGSVAEATAIYNLIKDHAARVVSWIDGIAASSAGWIAMAGDVVKIAENGYIMLHNPTNLVSGDAAGLRKEADVLDQVKATIARTFSSRTGIKQAAVENMMSVETWLVGSDAVAQGFADELSPNKAVNCSGDFDCFRNAPADAQRLTGPRATNATDTALIVQMADCFRPTKNEDTDQALIDQMNTLMV